MTEEDVHMMLGSPKGPLDVVKPKNESNLIIDFASLLNHRRQLWPKRDSIGVIEMIKGQVDGGEDFRRNFLMLVVSPCLHGNQRREVNYLIVNALVDLRK